MINPDALIEELAQQAIELRDSQGDAATAALLEKAANWIAAVLEQHPELRP